ncbi:MAG: carbohydrate ABC transporter permease, partial [Treponema sp.]|nr:carbohydrate ABC transporter permease [Treponema sp.]
WYFKNYPISWENAKFGILMINSVIYTVISTVAVLILSLAAGFAFAKIPSKLTPILHGSFIIGILLTIQSLMVPLFLMINLVGLYNTRIGVIICYVGTGLPIGVYLCTEFIKDIPESLIESARIDGAKYMRILSSIIMPIAVPVSVTLAILSVTGTWNEFMLINILVSKTELKSLPVGINQFSGARASDFGKQFSALVIGMAPMIIFYMIFRKQITKGVAAGAVKG